MHDGPKMRGPQAADRAQGRAIAIKITGHKTDPIFRRYLIVDEELLAQATGAVAELLGDGKESAEREPE